MFISVATVVQCCCRIHEQLVYQCYRGIATTHPEEGLLEYQWQVRVRMDIDIGIDNGSQISKPIDLATFFSATARAMCHISRVEEWSVIPATTLLPKADEQ